MSWSSDGGGMVAGSGVGTPSINSSSSTTYGSSLVPGIGDGTNVDEDTPETKRALATTESPKRVPSKRPIIPPIMYCFIL